MFTDYYIGLGNLQKLVKRPLETFEETRNSDSFDIYRNVLKSLTYLIHIFVEEETRLGTSQKGINDLNRAKGNKGKRRNKDDTVNFNNSINKLQ